MPDETATALMRPPVRRVVQVVAAATLVGFLLVDVLGPHVYAGERFASARPLSAPATNDGVGGLLPSAVLLRGSRKVDSRDLRPAVIVLVPTRCHCEDQIRHVVAHADGNLVRVYVVGVAERRQVDTLKARSGGDVVALLDPTKTLQTQYRPGPEGMVVFVRRDGVVTEIVDGINSQLDVRRLLPALLRTP